MNTDPQVIKRFRNALIAWVCSVVVLRLVSTVLRNSEGLDPFLSNVLREGIFAAVVLFFVHINHRWDIYKMSFSKLKEGLLTPAIIVVQNIMIFSFAILAGTQVNVSLIQFILFLFHMFLIGLSEESLFRGIIQNAVHELLTEKTVWHVRAGVVLSGILFGMTHLVNALDPKIGLAGALPQALLVSLTGCIFCATYYRTGRCLWYTILVHAVNDAIGFYAGGALSGTDLSTVIAQSSQSAGNPFTAQFFESYLPMIVVFLATTWILLRKSKVEPLLNQSQEQG